MNSTDIENHRLKTKLQKVENDLNFDIYELQKYNHELVQERDKLLAENALLLEQNICVGYNNAYLTKYIKESHQNNTELREEMERKNAYILILQSQIM